MKTAIGIAIGLALPLLLSSCALLKLPGRLIETAIAPLRAEVEDPVPAEGPKEDVLLALRSR